MSIHRTKPAVILSGFELALKAVTVVFLLVPAAIVVVLSFSAEKNVVFPPREWGLTQYVNLFSSEYWMESIVTSFAVALPAALIAVAVGVPAVIALERSRLPGKPLITALGIAPLVLPGVAYAVALYSMYVHTRLVGTQIGVILADAMLAIPFVIIVVSAGLKRISTDLELVAMSLGASRNRATFGITVRLLVPAIAAASILAFVTTFDEAVLVNFLGGGQVITLPKAIYDSVRTGIEPLITAIATLLMVFTGILLFGAARWRKDNAA